jgi:hypothetical protein
MTVRYVQLRYSEGSMQSQLLTCVIQHNQMENFVQRWRAVLTMLTDSHQVELRGAWIDASTDTFIFILDWPSDADSVNPDSVHWRNAVRATLTPLSDPMIYVRSEEMRLMRQLDVGNAP